MDEEQFFIRMVSQYHTIEEALERMEKAGYPKRKKEWAQEIMERKKLSLKKRTKNSDYRIALKDDNRTIYTEGGFTVLNGLFIVFKARTTHTEWTVPIHNITSIVKLEEGE